MSTAPGESFFAIDDEPLGRPFMLYDEADRSDQSYVLNNPYAESIYRIKDERLDVGDAIWGNITIGSEQGDEVFLDLVGHPVLQRLQGIEQLTLPKEMSTIAGTNGFTRWEHAWGSLALTRKLCLDLDIEPREQRKLELKALLSDSAHWAFSHLGDWILQGSGGNEDAHDEQQKDFLVKTGIDEVLERNGYSLNELLVTGSQPDWVECPAPDLCVDRVDFGVREIRRWLTRSPALSLALMGSAFSVDQGRLVMDSFLAAKMFTKAFLLLASEHWQEPVHRLQLTLLESIVKFGLIYDDPTFMQPLVDTTRYSPTDYLMSVDVDFEASMHTSHSLPWILHDLAVDIARNKRLIHRMVRSPELESFLENDKPFPDPTVATNWQGKQHPLTPSNVEIIDVNTPSDIADFMSNPNSIDFFLPALKPRTIDPLFKNSRGKVQRLSESDPYMKEVIASQRNMLTRSYVARVFMNKETRSLLAASLEEVHREWPAVMRRPKMPPNIFNEALRAATDYGIARRKTNIIWQR